MTQKKNIDLGFECGKEEGLIICEYTVGKALDYLKKLILEFNTQITEDEGRIYGSNDSWEMWKKIIKIAKAKR